MLDKSRQFALQAHGDQRYGKHPYSYHLDAVAEILQPYGEVAQVIGYLHDVVEDTAVELEQIAAEFNEFIANAVAILTDEPGNNRKERKQKTYLKMSQVDKELEIALLVKVADRLANVRAGVHFNELQKLQMYQMEHPLFTQSVYRDALCDELWSELNRLLGETNSKPQPA